MHIDNLHNKDIQDQKKSGLSPCTGPIECVQVVINDKAFRKCPKSFSFWSHPDFFKYNSSEELALYHWVKSRYTNSTFYRYKAYKLAQKTGLAPQTCKKYVQALIQSGLAFIHNGNLTMKATRKALRSYKSGWIKFQINKKDTLKDISELLYISIIKEAKDQQQYVLNLKTDISKMNDCSRKFSLKQIKALKRKEKEFTGKVYDQIVLTTRNLAKKTNISHSKMAKIISNLNKKGILNRKFLIDTLGIYSGEIYHNLGLGHTYSHNGILYIHRGSLININYESRFIITES